jgi:hypothetical protein
MLTFHPAPVAGGNIDGAELVAENDAGGLGVGQFDGEPAMAGKMAAMGDGGDKLNPKRIEGGRRHKDDRPVSALLATCCRIEVDDINVAALH